MSVHLYNISATFLWWEFFRLVISVSRTSKLITSYQSTLQTEPATSPTYPGSSFYLMSALARSSQDFPCVTWHGLGGLKNALSACSSSKRLEAIHSVSSAVDHCPLESTPHEFCTANPSNALTLPIPRQSMCHKFTVETMNNISSTELLSLLLKQPRRVFKPHTGVINSQTNVIDCHISFIKHCFVKSALFGV